MGIFSSSLLFSFECKKCQRPMFSYEWYENTTCIKCSKKEEVHSEKLNKCYIKLV